MNWPASVLGAALATIAGCDWPTSGEPDAATLSAGTPAVASNGVGYLVVWNDSRNEVSGTRVSSAGDVLDPAGITILQEAAYWRAGIASDGAGYLVVVEGHAARVAGDGRVLDPLGIQATPDNRVVLWAVGASDQNYLMAWSDSGDTIHGTPISVDGVVGSTEGLTLARVGSLVFVLPQLASNGAEYLLVWSDYTSPGPYACGLCAVRLSVDALVLDPSPLVLDARGSYSASVASNGSDYLIAWDIGGDVYYTRVSGTGEVLDPAGVRVSVEGFNVRPSVASNGTDYLVVWDGGMGRWSTLAARVSAEGAVLDPQPISMGSSEADPFSAVASDGTDYLVVWQEGSGSDLDVHAARVSAGGVVLDPEDFTVSPSVSN